MLAMLLAIPADGAQTRVLESKFGQLVAPRGIALDESDGSAYVADEGGFRVEKFSSTGSLMLGFGAGVGGLGVDTCSLACGVGVEGSGSGEFTAPRFIAVDNGAASASRGDVYVGDVGDEKVSKFDSAGHVLSSWGTEGQLDGSSTTTGSFGALAGIAVGADGTLYVLNRENTVFEFGQSGAFESEVRLKDGAPGERLGLTVNAAGHFFRAREDGSLMEFTATGVELGRVVPGRGGGAPGVGAFAMEPTGGDLYVASRGAKLEHYAFNGSGEVIEPGGGTCPIKLENINGCPATDSVALEFSGEGIAVAPNGTRVLLSNPESGEVFEYGPFVTVAEVAPRGVTAVHATEVELRGEVNPSGVALTECVFEYVDRSSFEAALKAKAANPYAGGGSTQCAESVGEIGSGTTGFDVHAHVTGLNPHAEYEFRLKAVNVEAAAVSDGEAFSTLPVPSIEREEVEALNADSAELVAVIDPHGAATEYHFEYDTVPYEKGGPEHGTAIPVPDANLGPETSGVPVRVHIEGLSEGTTYYWRVFAKNESGANYGSGNSFVHEAAAGLPDHRAYEMVTPARKNGALIGDVSFLGSVPDIGANGDRLVASSIQCFADSTSCNGQQSDAIGSPFAFERAKGGWTTTPLGPPATEFPVNAPWATDATTGYSLFSMPVEPDGENDFYVRSPRGGFGHIGPVTPPEEGPQGPVGGKTDALVQDQTGDFSHFAWQTRAKWPFDERKAGTLNAYEYAGTENAAPLLIGVTGGQGSTDQISACGTRLGAPNGINVRNAMSEDGKTVFFTALTEPVGECPSGTGTQSGTPVAADAIYARVDGESGAAHTTAISEPTPSECGSGAQAGEAACREEAATHAGAELLAASADGTKAFFLSTKQLTDDATEDHSGADSATAGEGSCTNTTATGCNLYEYDSANAAGHHLIDLSAGDSSGEGPRVQGALAVSPDGSHVYFVAGGVLTAQASGLGDHPHSGADNLYSFERDAAHPLGVVRFIAQLPASDSLEWRGQPGKPANVTPDGRYLVFLSHGDLTPDDTSASGAYQVFRYDAMDDQLIRISIGNNGFNNNGNETAPSACNTTCAEDAQIVQYVGFTRTDPTMSDDGAYVFFQSPVGLAPGALGDRQIGELEGEPVYAQNVYEWHEGHVYLISSGKDETLNNGGSPLCNLSSVCLLGADSSGANVFFSTVETLVGQDRDTELDYYDARVCTAESPCLDQAAPAEPSCGDQCQGEAGAPPPVAPIASVIFSGPGNVPGEAAPPPAVKVIGHRFTGSEFVLTVSVPGPGRLVVTAAGVKTATRSLTKSGSYKIAVVLTRRALRRLRTKHRLSLVVHLAFGSVASTQRALIAVVLRRGKAHPARKAKQKRGRP